MKECPRCDGYGWVYADEVDARNTIECGLCRGKGQVSDEYRPNP